MKELSLNTTRWEVHTAYGHLPALITELQQAKAEYDRQREPYCVGRRGVSWAVEQITNGQSAYVCDCNEEETATRIVALLNKAHQEGETE